MATGMTWCRYHPTSRSTASTALRAAAVQHPSREAICFRVIASNLARPNERAQGMPGVWPHPQPCVQNKKAHKLVTTGKPKQSGTPCAMVYRLIPSSPRRSAFLSPSSAMSSHRKLDIGVEISGPRGFTVREWRIRLLRYSRPSLPASNVDDDAQRPSYRARDGVKRCQ
jgi:hypothetical protein